MRELLPGYEHRARRWRRRSCCSFPRSFSRKAGAPPSHGSLEDRGGPICSSRLVAFYYSASHGENRGSSPLGTANYFKYLRRRWFFVSNACPINVYGQQSSRGSPHIHADGTPAPFSSIRARRAGGAGRLRQRPDHYQPTLVDPQRARPGRPAASKRASYAPRRRQGRRPSRRSSRPA
jgi:hypothetical protein